MLPLTIYKPLDSITLEYRWTVTGRLCQPKSSTTKDHIPNAFSTRSKILTACLDYSWTIPCVEDFNAELPLVAKKKNGSQFTNNNQLYYHLDILLSAT